MFQVVAVGRCGWLTVGGGGDAATHPIVLRTPPAEDHSLPPPEDVNSAEAESWH